MVLYLCSLEHLVALSFLARVLVIAWLTIDLRLIEVGIEIARVRPVAHVNREPVREERSSLAYFGTRDKKSDN